MWAFILAAGRGERMRPLTLVRPKPSLPFRGIPIIRRIAEAISPYVNRMGANLHYHPHEIVRALTGLDFVFSMEKKLLGTCGGVKRMVGVFSPQEDVLIHNGDTLMLSSYEEFIWTHKNGNSPITIALCPHKEPYNRIDLKKGRMIFGDGEYFYCGAVIISKDILGEIPDGGNLILDFVSKYPVTPFFAKALEFTDPMGYFQSHGQGLWLEEGAKVHSLALVENSIVMKDVEVGKGAAVLNSILVSGNVPPGEVLKGKILVEGEVYELA